MTGSICGLALPCHAVVRINQIPNPQTVQQQRFSLPDALLGWVKVIVARAILPSDFPIFLFFIFQKRQVYDSRGRKELLPNGRYVGQSRNPEKEEWMYSVE